MSEPLKMWELYPEYWKTESAFCSFIRGGIRRHLWSKNPVKLQFVKEKRLRIVNKDPRSKKAHPTVWGFKCEHCLKEFKGSACEVDHKVGGHSLRKVEDVQKFVEGIVFIRKEDLQLLCKPCHKAKSYSESQGMSIAEAIIEKGVIEICKRKAAEIDSFLLENGVTLTRKNKDTRRDAVREILSRK